MYLLPTGFLPRDMLCVSAVLAVARCPSVTFVYCIQTAEDIVKLLPRSGSPIILVSLTPSADSNSNGNPSAGVQNTRGGKNLRFSTEITVYL